MPHQPKSTDAAAYGGPGWIGRSTTLREELGGIWAACGIDSEWRRLRAVLLHRPGAELAASAEPDAALMLAPLDLGPSPSLRTVALKTRSGVVGPLIARKRSSFRSCYGVRV